MNVLILKLLRFAFPFSRRPLVQRDKRKSWVKWQPAFRLVKVVFVVVNRQHRVHNQTVVPVVSVVVKTKAQKVLSTLLRLQRDNYLNEITQGAATLYPGLCAFALSARQLPMARYCLPGSSFCQNTPGLRPGLRTLRLVQPSRLTST